MRRMTVATAVAALVALGGSVALAGNAHFVGDPRAQRSGSTLTLSGKVAGLGNEESINVEVTADAACVNRGNKNPEAENKDSFSADDDFPVQNGKANFSLNLAASFSPNCSPPMRVVFSNVTITVTADGIFLQATFPGPF
jgi:hypothetical protein